MLNTWNSFDRFFGVLKRLRKQKKVCKANRDDESPSSHHFTFLWMFDEFGGNNMCFTNAWRLLNENVLKVLRSFGWKIRIWRLLFAVECIQNRENIDQKMELIKEKWKCHSLQYWARNWAGRNSGRSGSEWNAKLQSSMLSPQRLCGCYSLKRLASKNNRVLISVPAHKIITFKWCFYVFKEA